MARIQDLNGRMAETSRVLERTTNELQHITANGVAPAMLDVPVKRQAAPAAAAAWADRVAAARAKFDELAAVLGPLLDEAHRDALTLADELEAEWQATLAAEAAERAAAALERRVDAGVLAERQRQDDELRAKVRGELTTTGGKSR